MILLIPILVCFLFQVFSVLLFQKSICKEMCVCLCLAVNSAACYVWIVNDITDSHTCFVFQGFVFYSSLE